MAMSRRKLEEEVARLNGRVNSLVLLTSILRQGFQRLCLEEAFVCTVGTKARVATNGQNLDTFLVAPENFPVPSLERMLKNSLASELYNG